MPLAQPILASSVIGLAQGLALYLLGWAEASHPGTATRTWLLSPAVAALVSVPLFAMLGLPRIRGRALSTWLVVAAVVAALLGHHGAVRGAALAPAGTPLAQGFAAAATGALFINLLLAVLFVAHSLVQSALTDRRLRPRYATLFDTSWTLAVEAVLAGLFSLLLWAVLLLGTLLLGMVHVGGLLWLIRQRWFDVPLTSTSVGFAIGVAAARDSLVRSARSLVLTLLGFLLALLAPLVAVFLAALCVGASAPLAHHVGRLLCGVGLVLLVLINASYQDGRELPPAAPLRAITRLACVLLVPVVALAATALARRVGEYGWTPTRIGAAATLLLGAIYAAGYAVAACCPGRWLARLEGVNFAAAIVGVAVGLAILSPLADPARLAAADQVARLRDGRVDAGRFDWAFLRSGASGYGLASLRALADDPREPAPVRDKAGAALATGGPPAAAPAAPRITVHPAGAALPDGFLRDARDRRNTGGVWVPCLQGVNNLTCDAVRLDGGAGVGIEIAVVGGAVPTVPFFGRAPDGHWRVVSTLNLPARCRAERAALLAGAVTTAPASRPDLVLAGRHMTPSVPFADLCPGELAPPSGR